MQNKTNCNWDKHSIKNVPDNLNQYTIFLKILQVIEEWKHLTTAKHLTEH